MSRKRRVVDVEGDFEVPAGMLERARAEVSPAKIRSQTAGKKRKTTAGKGSTNTNTVVDSREIAQRSLHSTVERWDDQPSAQEDGLDIEGHVEHDDDGLLGLAASSGPMAVQPDMATTTDSSSPFYPDEEGDGDNELRRYADAVDTAAARFDYLVGQLFIVQGWDSSRMQATVSFESVLTLFSNAHGDYRTIGFTSHTSLWTRSPARSLSRVPVARACTETAYTSGTSRNTAWRNLIELRVSFLPCGGYIA
jgi:hypothetical protein